jgi:hypothetical protein
VLEPFCDALIIAAFVFGPILGGMAVEALTHHTERDPHGMNVHTDCES